MSLLSALHRRKAFERATAAAAADATRIQMNKQNKSTAVFLQFRKYNVCKRSQTLWQNKQKIIHISKAKGIE